MDRSQQCELSTYCVLSTDCKSNSTMAFSLSLFFQPRNLDKVISRKKKTTTNFLSPKKKFKCFFLTSLSSEGHLGFFPKSPVFRVSLYSYHYLYHYFMYIFITLCFIPILLYQIYISRFTRQSKVNENTHKKVSVRLLNKRGEKTTNQLLIPLFVTFVLQIDPFL